MAEQILYPQWRNQHGGTAYPFAAHATLRSDDGKLVPARFFVDACLYIAGNTGTLHLAEVAVAADALTLTISDATGTLRATGTLALPMATTDGSHVRNSIAFLDVYDRPAGIVVFDATWLFEFLAWGEGTTTFQPSATTLAAGAVVPMADTGVQGLLLDDGTLLTGKAWLIGDDGVILSHATEYGALAAGYTGAIETIRVDVVGDPLFKRRLCLASDLFATPNFVRVITARVGETEHELEPDAAGNVLLTVNNEAAPRTVLRVTPTAEGTIIETIGSTISG